MEKIFAFTARILKERKKSKVWHTLSMIIACMVVFTTTYAMILPALSLDEYTAAGEPGIYLDQNQGDTDFLSEYSSQTGEPVILDSGSEYYTGTEATGTDAPVDLSTGPDLSNVGYSDSGITPGENGGGNPLPDLLSGDELSGMSSDPAAAGQVEENTTVLNYEDENLRVGITFDAAGAFPAGTVLKAELLPAEDLDYINCKTVVPNGIASFGYYDISYENYIRLTFLYEGQPIVTTCPAWVNVSVANVMPSQFGQRLFGVIINEAFAPVIFDETWPQGIVSETWSPWMEEISFHVNKFAEASCTLMGIVNVVDHVEEEKTEEISNENKDELTDSNTNTENTETLENTANTDHTENENTNNENTDNENTNNENTNNENTNNENTDNGITDNENTDNAKETNGTPDELSTTENPVEENSVEENSTEGNSTEENADNEKSEIPENAQNTENKENTDNPADADNTADVDSTTGIDSTVDNDSTVNTDSTADTDTAADTDSTADTDGTINTDDQGNQSETRNENVTDDVTDENKEAADGTAADASEEKPDAQDELETGDKENASSEDSENADGESGKTDESAGQNENAEGTEELQNQEEGSENPEKPAEGSDELQKPDKESEEAEETDGQDTETVDSENAQDQNEGSKDTTDDQDEESGKPTEDQEDENKTDSDLHPEEEQQGTESDEDLETAETILPIYIFEEKQSATLSTILKAAGVVLDSAISSVTCDPDVVEITPMEFAYSMWTKGHNYKIEAREYFDEAVLVIETEDEAVYSVTLKNPAPEETENETDDTETEDTETEDNEKKENTLIEGGNIAINGNTGISLTAMAEELGFAEKLAAGSFSLSEVKDVLVYGTSFVKVSQNTEDWEIFIEAAEENISGFTADLTVEMKSGEKIDVVVTVSGTPTVEAENVVISSADGAYLPEEAEGSAQVLNEEESAAAISAVENSDAVNESPEAAASTEGSLGQESSEIMDAASQNANAEAETNANNSSTENVSDADQNIAAENNTENNSASDPALTEGRATQYEVFDISLDLTEEQKAQYENGFKVDLTLPEAITGKDFRLFHIHDGVTEEVTIDKTGYVADPETGLEVVTGVSFQVGDFSEFVLRYTVEFEVVDEGGNTVKTGNFSFIGGKNIALKDVLEEAEIFNVYDAEESGQPNLDAAEDRNSEDNLAVFIASIKDITLEGTDFVSLNKDDENLANWIFEFADDEIDHSGEAGTLTISMADGKQYVITMTVTGQKQAEAGDLAVISAASGIYLQEEATASAVILTDEKCAEAAEKIEAAVDNFSKDNISVPERDKILTKTEYQAFDICLEGVDSEAYRDGFKVAVSLPKQVKGRDFHLYHIHEGQEPEEITETLNMTGSVNNKTGLEVVSGFEFLTDGFSDFVLSYTVDFEYNGYKWSWPGMGRYAITDIMAEIGVSGDVIDAALLRTADEGGAANVLYLSDDKSELISEAAFSDTFELILKVLEETDVTGEMSAESVEKAYVITITDDTAVFNSTIKFFAADAAVVPKTSTTPMHIEGNAEPPQLSNYYYLLAILYDNDNNKIGWKAEPITVGADATEVSVSFSSFYEFETDILPGAEGYGTSTTSTIAYNPSQNKVETRLYRTEYVLAGADLSYNGLVVQGKGSDHPEEGYEFGGNFINSSGINEIHLKKAVSDKKYYVRVRFDEEASAVFEDKEGDRYYVNVKVTHASSSNNEPDSFQGALLNVNPASLSVDSETGLHYIDFEFTNWQDGAGNPKTGSNTVFTGYEDTILVELIRQWQASYQPNYDQNNAKPIPEGTLAKAYRVHYDTKLTNPKDTPTGFYEDRTTDHVYCYDYIDLMTIHATDDYDYNTILGPNLSYGIVADHLFQGNDLQTNFAVNHYSSHGHYVSPDLSGNSSGAIVIGEFNVVDGMAENGTGAIAYDDTWGRLPIGNILNNTLIVYVDDDTGYNAPDGNVSNVDQKAVIVVPADGQELQSTMVQPGIDYGIAMSNALMSRQDTFTPPIASTTSGTIDTTGFPDGTTIYIDGDLLAELMKTSGGLTIKKIENQTIIFNFDSTRDLEVNQFKVEQYKYDNGSLVKDFDLLTSTDVSKTEQNVKMDKVSRHLVWNLNGVKGKTTINTAGGIFLQPNRNSEIDIAGTSGGWIVSNGFVYNSSAEWHNFYADMPDTNKLNLRAIKTVDGKIPRAGQQFEFFLKEFNPGAAEEQDKWTQIVTVQRNNNASIVFPEMHDLTEGWHVYKIHENTTVPTGEGIEAGLYIVDQTEYYALVHVTKTTDPQGDRYIITPPAYYMGPFDETKFSVTDGAGEGAFGNKVTTAAFDNAAVKEGLTIEKKVVGTTDTTRRFTFVVELKSSSGEPLTGSYTYTVTGVPAAKTLMLDSDGKGEIVLRNGQKATIEGLPVGTKYTVTETKVETKAINTSNKDANGYVDGYETPGEPESGEIGEGGIAVTSFTNTYHAAGSVSLKAKKVLHNGDSNTEMDLSANQFRFTLTPLNSVNAQPETVFNDANGNVHFSTLNFTEADMTGATVMPNGERVKTLVFYVTESDGTLDNFNYGNVTYDETKTVLVTLTDDGKGNIKVKSDLENFTVGINNVYQKKAAGTLEGTKKLIGRDLADGEFTFTARLYKTIVNNAVKTYTTDEKIEVTETSNGQQITVLKPNPEYLTEVFATPTKLIGTNTAMSADETGEKPVATGAITFPTVNYLEAGEYFYQISENTGLGELPMGVTAKDASKVYYAKVTVPPAADRSDECIATVEYYTDENCTVSIQKNDVVFENEQRNINFTVTKSWTDNTGALKTDGYSIVFSVKKNGQPYPVTANHLDVVSGTNAQVEIQEDGTVKLIGSANGWPVVKIKNVPEATYVVEETLKTPASGDTNEYHTTYTVNSSTSTTPARITEDDSTLTIYNTQGDDKYTTITVEKKWMAGETEYTPDEGGVTFLLTQKETKQVEVVGGKAIHAAIGNTVVNNAVHVGNNLLAIYTFTFDSVGQKQGFYNNYNNSPKLIVGYSTDSSNFDNGDATGSGRQEIKMPQPCPLTSEEIAAINDTNSVQVAFVIPTSGQVNGHTIDTSVLTAIKIHDGQFDNTASHTFDGFAEEATYDTVTTTTTSEFTVTAAENWKKVLSGLPLSKSDPVTSYTYSVEEIAVNGKPVSDADFPFTVTYSGDHEDIVGGTVVATNTKDSIVVRVDKQWKFPNGSTTWPNDVTVSVKLQNNGVDVQGKTAALNAEHPYVIFEDLDKEGVYTVVETSNTYNGNLIKLISGDATTGFKIINYATDTNVTVQKIWDTEPTENWTATFKLQKARVAKIAENGVLLSTPVPVAIADNWQDVSGQGSITISKSGANPVTLSALPTAEQDGSAVYSLKYQVVETNLIIGNSSDNRIDPDNGDYRYELMQVGDTGNNYAIKVKNKVDDTKTSLTVNKVWQGGNPPADASIEVTLGRFKLVEQQPGTITIIDSYSGLLSGDSYNVQYTITGGGYNDQVISSGSSVPAGTYTITKTVTVDSNKYSGATNATETSGTITVTEGQESSVTFSETVFTPITGTLTISDDYTDAPEGYSVSYRITGPYGYDVTTGDTSLPSLPKGSYTVVKTVTAPSGYTITSYATDSQTVEVSASGGTATMAKTEFAVQEEKEIYMLTFLSSADGLSKVYRFEEGTEVTVTFDNGNKYYNPYENVTLSGDATGVITGSVYNFIVTMNGNKTITLTETNFRNWGNVVTESLNTSPNGLPDSILPNMLSANRPASAPRMFAMGMTRGLASNSTPITGQITVTTTTITVTNDAADPTYSGYNNVTDTWSKVVTLDNSNSWTSVVDKLPKTDLEGNVYVYYIASVTENGVPTGTTAIITTEDGKKQVVRGDHGVGDNTALSLTDTLPKTSISANKTWVHGTNPVASQPTSVKFTLYEDGDSKGEKTVTSTDDWTVSWGDLELYKADGTLHSYTVTEEDVTDYALTSMTYDEGTQTFTLTNTYTPSNSSVQVTKVFSGINSLPENFRITNSYNDSVFTVNGNDGTVMPSSGDGTDSSPYIWTITDVPVGTVVTFTESGYEDNSYTVTTTAKSSNAAEFTTGTSASATSVQAAIATAALKNVYTRNTGSLNIRKTGKVNGGNPTDANKALIDGAYSFTIKGTGDAGETVNKSITITIANGVATAVQPTADASVANGIVTIANLPTGTYTITENLTDEQQASGISLLLPSSGDTSVTVTANNSENIPTAEFVNNNPFVEVNIPGIKTFTNGTIGQDQFSFTIDRSGENTDGPLPATTTVYAGTNGNFSFGPIKYVPTDLGNNVTKSFAYTITENLPTGVTVEEADRTAGYKIVNGIKYDLTPKTVNVQVSYDATTGVMTATAPTTASTTFTNEQLGELKITKNIVAQRDTDKTGTFWYAVFKAADVEEVGEAPNKTKQPKSDTHSVRTGSIEVAAGDTGTKTVTERDLPYGKYYVFELYGEPTVDQGGKEILSIVLDGNATIGGKVYSVTGSGTTEAQINASPGTATLTNTVPDADFHFTKEWRITGEPAEEEAWPVNVTIPSFTIKRTLDYTSTDGIKHSIQDENFSAVFSNIGENVSNMVPDDSSKLDGFTGIRLNRTGTGNDFTYTVSKLPKYGQMSVDGTVHIGEWRYRVEEAQVSGYNVPVYLNSSHEKTDKPYAEDNGIIQNNLITVSLPATGGSGTKMFHLFGAAMILFAGALLLIKRKHGLDLIPRND